MKREENQTCGEIVYHVYVLGNRDEALANGIPAWASTGVIEIIRRTWRRRDAIWSLDMKSA